MNELPALVVAWVAGLALGAIFFGGLWWTVRQGLTSQRPALWLLGSAVLRMSIALTGFYLVGGGHWQRLVACLVGFLMARLAATGLPRLPGTALPAREASHAP